jgi:hypothetical protein
VGSAGAIFGLMRVWSCLKYKEFIFWLQAEKGESKESFSGICCFLIAFSSQSILM